MMDSYNRPLTDYLIVTTDGRHIAWAGYDQGHARRSAEHSGHKVVDVTPLNQTQEA